MPVYRFGPYTLDGEARELSRRGQRIPLASRAFDVLRLLVEADGRLVDRATFQSALWSDTVVEQHNLTVHISTLRSALNENGLDYIETVPKAGYRLAVSVTRVAPTTAHPIADAEPVAASASERTWRLGVRAAFVVGGLLMMVVLGGLSLRSRDTRAMTSPAAVLRVAVLPFVVASDLPDDAGLGLGLADAIILNLDATDALLVRSTSTVMPFANGGDAVTIGRSLDVDQVIEGVVTRSGSIAQVSSRIVDVATGATHWREHFEQPYTGFFELQDAVAARVASALMRRMNVEATWTQHPRRPANPEAYRAYLEARMHMHQSWRPGAVDNAINAFRRAIALDGAFAPSYSGLARAYRVKSAAYGPDASELVQLAWRAVEKAIQLDPRLPEAHTALGMLKYNFAFDWVGAERDLRRAVDLDPDNEDALSWLANFLRVQGRADESITLLERVRQVNPIMSQYAQLLGEAYWFAGRSDDAVGMLEQAARLNPQNETPHWRRVMVLDSVRRGEEALAAREIAAKVGGDQAYLDGLREARAHGYAAVLEYDLSLRRQQKDYWEAAALEALLGRHDPAIAALEQCIAIHCPNAPLLATEPRLRPLHGDPRFRALAARINLVSLLP